jgi:hypothetical protein
VNNGYCLAICVSKKHLIRNFRVINTRSAPITPLQKAGISVKFGLKFVPRVRVQISMV